MNRVSGTVTVNRVLFDIGEGSTYPGTREKLEGSLGNSQIGFLPFYRKDSFVPQGVINNVLLRRIALYMRY